MGAERVIVAAPLTAEAFAPFGDVIAVGARQGKDANQGTAQRIDHCARLASSRVHAQHNLAVFRAQPQAVPLTLKLVERHPCSSQAFIPLDVSRYLIMVCPTLADGGPALDQLRAFVVAGGTGINYLAGTWHHPIVALDHSADFAMLVWEDGTAKDCEEFPLDGRWQVTLG